MISSEVIETQVEDNFDILIDLYTRLKSYVIDPDQEITPSFKDTVKALEYGNVLTNATNNTKNNPGYVNAILIDHIQMIEGLLRDSVIRYKTKRDYFSAAENNVDAEISYLQSEKTKVMNYIRGAMPQQGNI